MNTRLFILFFALCLCKYNGVFSETIATTNFQNDGNKVMIKGAVKTTKGETLPFSTIKITLKSEGKELSYSQVADNNGYFNVSVAESAKYFIEANFAGMKTKTAEVTLQQVKGNTITIELEEDATALDQVVVTKKRELIKVELDKLTYDIAGDPTSSSNSVLEMLRKVPLVTVSGNGEIQVNGSSNFQIFINGKPTKALGEKPQEALRAMPAVSIKNIEVITEPGVKYGVDGAGAILNIITENKSATNGYNGTVSTSLAMQEYGMYNRNNVYFNLSKNDWGFNINLNNFNSKDKEKPFVFKDYLSENEVYETANKVSTKYLSPIGMRSNFFYNITPKDLINASVNIKYNTSDDVISKISENPNTMDTRSYKNDKKLSPNFSVDYQHSFDREGAFFTMSYLFDSYNSTSMTKEIDKNNEIIYFQDPSKTKFKENTVQMDFVIPFAKIHTIETGTKYINRYNYSNAIDRVDESKSREYVYIYNIASLYADYKLNIKDITFRAGARGEMTFIDLTDYGKKIDVSPRFDWIPNVSIGYNINPMTNIKLNYNFRVARPTIWQLSPNESFMTSSFSQVGNPNLKSAKTHDWGLTFGHFSPVISLRFTADFILYKDQIENTFETKITGNGGLKTIASFKNIDGGHGFNFNVYAGYNKIQWLRPHISLNYSIDKYEGMSRYNHYYHGNLGADFLLPKDFTVNVGGGFFKHRISNDITMKPSGYAYLGVTKDFFEKRFGVSLSGTYMPRVLEIVSSDQTKYPYIKLYQPLSREISLSLTYRFGNSSQNQKKVNKSISNDDKSTNQGLSF